LVQLLKLLGCYVTDDDDYDGGCGCGGGGEVSVVVTAKTTN
jgi:hypothetical protein